MRCLIAMTLAALAASVPACAAMAASLDQPADSPDIRIGLHLGSKHFQSEFKYNNVNPGLYVVYDGWTAGGYYNSERRPSFYAGYTWEYRTKFLTPGLTVGAITGYKRASVLPMIVPSISVGLTEQVSARLTFIPKVEKSSASVLHLSIERKF